MTNLIAVHSKGNEGGLHIDAMTGQIITPPGERPEWADGYAVALLASRTGWYEKRLGQQLPDSIRKPDLLAAQDLDWIGVDAEGEEVEIEADTDYRMDILAGLLSIDREDHDQERNFQNVLAQADIDHSYTTHPTTEATLEEVEGVSFEQHQAKAVNEK